MLEMNLETSINNINYLRFMEEQEEQQKKEKLTVTQKELLEPGRTTTRPGYEKNWRLPENHPGA